MSVLMVVFINKDMSHVNNKIARISLFTAQTCAIVVRSVILPCADVPHPGQTPTMLLFCPLCGTFLQISTSSTAGGEPAFVCQACPYTFPIAEKSYSARVELTRKRVDDVLGGEDAWKNVDSTDTVCPKCEHTRAYFMQIQIRSADEPSSIFYKCCKSSCGHQWREG